VQLQINTPQHSDRSMIDLTTAQNGKILVTRTLGVETNQKTFVHENTTV
jgi:hypothetical protein